MNEIDKSVEKVDAILRARRIGKMLITEVPAEADTAPEKILYDFQQMSAADLIAAYQSYMATFYTAPCDSEGNLLRFYAGEWTIWSGHPGTGKTTYLRQMVCDLLKAGETVFIAPLEEDPQWYIVKLAAVAAGVDEPTTAHLESFLGLYGDRLKIWSVPGIADHRQIMATVRDLAKNHGCKHAIIDSLMALDIEEGDNEAQRQFSNLVSTAAKLLGIHIHLVAHPRKPVSADEKPQTWDVAGSSNLTRLSWNVIWIRRGDPLPAYPDVGRLLVHILKQRTKGRTGEIVGFFHIKQNQFRLDEYTKDPLRYLPDEMYPATGMTEDIPESIMRTNAHRDDESPVRAFTSGLGESPWDM